MNTRRPWWYLLPLAALLAGCPDNGRFLNLCNNPDLSCDDGDACTIDRCEPAVGCVNESIDCGDGSACTVDTCEPDSGCVNTALSCDDGDLCTEDMCDEAAGCVHADVSASCDDDTVCTTDTCDPSVGCVNAVIDCDDDNECTAESCDAVSGCDSTPVADGTSCNRGLGLCASGVCEAVDCSDDLGCDDRDACTMDTCNVSTNQCVHVDVSAGCDDGNACTEDRCDPVSGCLNTDVSAGCDDGDGCTVDSCDESAGCTSEPAADGTPCDGGAGQCTGGACVSTAVVEYEQDFESFDLMNVNALADDGWIVFGNVFDGSTMDFLYGYGPFVAPNDGAAFSALVSGQGGAEQGAQQVSIYSDYNNTDHSNGHTIESNVFRERSITAADVGRTLFFGFDAKRGNINDPSDALCPCSSKAFAFIKTLDPDAGFATTNFVQQDATALPEIWERYEISLAVDSGLDGQLLQVGFTCTATLFQPSANFYDNVEVRSVATTP